MRDESNKEQLELVKKTCQGFEACQLDATRQYFGNDECPGTEDEKMALWLEYSCVGGTDRTTHPVQKTANKFAGYRSVPNNEQLSSPLQVYSSFIVLPCFFSHVDPQTITKE